MRHRAGPGDPPAFGAAERAVDAGGGAGAVGHGAGADESESGPVEHEVAFAGRDSVPGALGVEPPVRSARVRLGVGAVVVLLVGALVVAVAVSAFAQRGSEVPLAPASPVSSSASFEPSGAPRVELLVHVLGAVRTPGLVSLHAGSRVVDAVGAAGGLTDDADPGGVNLARPVADGEQLYVPKAGESPGGPGATGPGGASGGGGLASGGAGGSAGAGGKVNLNTAAGPELETLPRIGPALAQRIIDWRESNGRFSAVADLRKVTGIGDKLFDGLKDLVTV